MAVTPSCWLWTAARTTPGGYGKVKLDGRTCLAHRVAFEELVGPIPDGLQLDHLCRVRECVNPAHLEPVTASENLRRSPIVGRHPRPPSPDRCPQGHQYDETNARRDRGRIYCKTCKRERALAYYHRTKARRVG